MPLDQQALRVLIVAPNASTRFGGEAILPWHHFRGLRRRGVDAHLLVHARTRDELLELAPEDRDRMHFAPDLASQRFLHRAGRPLTERVAEYTVGFGIQWLGARVQRRMARDLVHRFGIHVVHEPTPVSPKQPSCMVGVGAPVVIGPMNGGMDFPPAFAGRKSPLERALVSAGRATARAANALVRGKRDAALLLVANERTRRALPPGLGPPVELLVENGVDLGRFPARAAPPTRAPGDAGFVFVGRLIALKGVDLLLHALAATPAGYHLDIVGDGPVRQSLADLAKELRLDTRVRFHGQVSQTQCSAILAQCDALVLPSLRECGGAVVLEAMATGLPVIATDWGGPADYLDGASGFLVAPTGRDTFVAGLRAAMERLGGDPSLRERMGRAGRARVEAEFDWERKIDHMLRLYAKVAASGVPHPVRSA